MDLGGLRAGLDAAARVVTAGDATTVAAAVDLVAATDPRLRLAVGAVATAVGATLTSVGLLSPVVSGTAARPNSGLRTRRRRSEGPEPEARQRRPADGGRTANRRRTLSLVALGVGCLVVGVASFVSVRPGV